MPIIGVIDTGVSEQTPLKSILINTNNDYGISTTNPLIDNFGHGTAVAAFAALGTQLAGKVQPIINANAKILSIKVLDTRKGTLSNSTVAKFITQSHKQYGIKIFTLTICYTNPKKRNELHSDYAFHLDSLAHDLGIIIFISIGNYDEFPNSHHLYPTHFKKDETNLFSPAESMNNITVGAVGDNFEKPIPFTAAKEEFCFGSLPAGYSRTYHLDYDSLTKANGKLFKPDVVFGGGNYVKITHKLLGIVLENTDESALQCLSPDPSVSFQRDIGTSYSTPLVANLAAKILRAFPDIRIQTVKALIINSCEPVNFGIYDADLKSYHKRYITGNGVPSEEKCLHSNDNIVTIVIEGRIRAGRITAIPINLPPRLKTSNRSQTVLEIDATLCYSFKPIQNNQLAYCPINICFGIMRNLPLDKRESTVSESGKKTSKAIGINGNSKKESSISSTIGWSQDGFYKSNILSNSQKLRITVNRDTIEKEDGIFQLAINSHFHRILPKYVTAPLPQEYEYSLVLRLKENKLSTDKDSNSLFQDIQALNTVKLLNQISLDTSADLEAEIK